uniref:Uncharacterized protein n=1 Tax=Anolis carolinensis TaxID=28377 RepID=A0A803SYM5_ANOCA
MGDAGAYGTAKAGSPFDLWRFLQQPQVLTRLLSTVSWDSGWWLEQSWPRTAHCWTRARLP